MQWYKHGMALKTCTNGSLGWWLQVGHYCEYFLSHEHAQRQFYIGKLSPSALRDHQD